MVKTENGYNSTDLGNITFNPRGEYSKDTTYEYLDTVSYRGGSYMCLVDLGDTITGIEPTEGKNTKYWQLIAIPGDITERYTKMYEDVATKSGQVEVSRAAVSESQRQVEMAEADVKQMRQDTLNAAETAISSASSASESAQSAEASRTAAKECEDNVKALATTFDSHVNEKISEAEKEINNTKQNAVDAVSESLNAAVTKIENETNKQVKSVEDTGVSQVSAVNKAGKSRVDEISTAGSTMINAVEIQQKKSVQAVTDEGTKQIKAVSDKATEQISAVNKVGSTQISTIESKGSEQVKAVQNAGENALQNISDGVDKGLSEEGKAADAKATGEAISKLTEDISNKITKFYASNQGETHLADSDNGKIQDMMIYGKSEQFTATGKNLLKIRDRVQAARGITVTAKDGVVALKGTATETGWAILDVDSFVLDGTYILSSNIPTDIRIIVTNKSYKSILEQGKSAVLENTEISKVCFTVTEGKTYDISNILVQIEKGSKATSYEPYVGGQPSPSPDYPQKIKSVVNPIVKVFGANILRLNDIKETAFTTTGVTFSVKDGVIKVKGTVLADDNISTDITGLISIIELLTLQSGKTYIYNPNPIKGAESYDCYLDFTNSATLGFSLASKNFNKPIKLTDLQAKFPFRLNLILKKGAVVDMEWKPQVLLNEVLLPYEPYKEQSIQLPITLNAIPVSSDGNVTINGQQYVADYVDVERGKLVKRVYEYVFSDKDRWVAAADGAQYLAWRVGDNPEIIDSTYDKKCLCSCLIANILSTTRKGENYISTQSLGNKCRVWVSANVATSKLTGEKVFLALIVPEEISLTQEEIRAFKELAAYYPVTNVNVASEQLNGYTVFNYPVSMKNGWNYVKQQLNDNRDYIYDMDLQSTEAYVNSEYAVALTELEV